MVLWTSVRSQQNCLEKGYLLMTLSCCMRTLPRGGMKHCECFPREDVFLIFALGSVRGNTVPRAVYLRTLPKAQGLYWII